MEYVINSNTIKCHRCFAVVHFTNIAAHKTKIFPLRRRNQALHLIQIVLVSSGKIVQTNDALIQCEQGFEQIAADESGHPGDKPRAGFVTQALTHGLVRCHWV